jgi:TPR repeat protein
MLTLYGDGVPQNYADAMKWYLQAAKQGDAGAQSSLGMIYKRGYGVPQNYILAYMWYTVSAHDPDEKFFVKKSLDEISPHMAPSQIAEAERLARQCLQSYTVCNSAPQTTEHW